METLAILERLLSHDSVSSRPNRALIDALATLLQDAGARVRVMPDATGTKANLFASIGPDRPGGVMLSGHTDVVPVEGQDWTVPPFAMTVRDGRVYGRGAADMKGFVAAATAAALKAARMDLRMPLHLAFSHDEEIGCVGVRPMVEMLARAPERPSLCIVGEPTGMAVATGHKGKTAIRATCRGREGHSALAPLAVNALYLATDLVAAIRAEQVALCDGVGSRDDDYDVPYTTLHVGRLAGGVALNIVPALATVDWEIRNLAADDPAAILSRIADAAGRIAEQVRDRAPDAAIDMEVVNSYPGLETDPDGQALRFVRELTGANGTIKVAFGTEGGLWSRDAGVPVVICGPGSMAQGHKPDEYVTLEQLAACDAMLSRLLERLCDGTGPA